MKCHINQKEQRTRSLVKVFEFVDKNLWKKIWDRGSSHLYHSGFEYDPKCEGAKLVESQWLKNYYKTSEAFELVLLRKDEPYTFGCIYKSDSQWVARDLETKELKTFENCLLAAEWLCSKAYKRYDIDQLIQHDFRLFELAVSDIKAKEVRKFFPHCIPQLPNELFESWVGKGEN